MGRQNFDSNLVCSSSSIALLQERFRQLQRVREKREEREEVLKLFSEADERINNSSSSTLLFQRSKMSSQPEKRTVPVRQQQQLPHLHDSLALGLNLQSRRTGTVAPLTNLWSSGAATDVVSKPKNFFDNSDVDTSLHL